MAWSASSEAPAIVINTRQPIYSRVGDASGVPISGLARMDASMPLDFPPDTTLSGEEFFRTEGAYTSLGAPIPGGQVDRWILREGPHIDSIVEMFDEMCW